jgi:hypothetical protein
MLSLQAAARISPRWLAAKHRRAVGVGRQQITIAVGRGDGGMGKGGGFWQLFALVGLDFDPNTQMRINVRANSRAALLWNMRKGELLLRFANYDLPLPYTEVDWLRVLILDLQSYFKNVTSHYYRMMVGSGTDARAMMVCVTKIKTFNSLGRISQVSLCSIFTHARIVEG